MESSASETESSVFATKKPAASLRRRKKSKNISSSSSPKVQDWPRKNRVTLEGYVKVADGSGDQGSESGGGSGVGRTKSLTDEDLEELKGCLDLGFGFSYDEIPELCNTLPALELCYSMSQRFLDEHRTYSDSNNSSDQDSVTSSSPSPSPSVANWKISRPGDHPDEVKARLKYWAQAVACTVRLCR